ncbi:hypothetical protein D3C86_1598740 [compost metagenome]
MDQAEWRGVRANDETGDDVSQHHRLFQPMEDHGYHTCDQHDHCQILNETDGMHGVRLPGWYCSIPGRRKSLIEQNKNRNCT